MNKQILVIEDNTEVRENICEILELAGYGVLGAENGKVGVDLALSKQPDLILCDVMMPELDGFGVLRILNRNSITLNTPFMFLTAKTEKLDFRKGMGLGADDYITKPFDDVDLLDAIEMRLKKSEHFQKSFANTEQGLQQFFNEAKGDQALYELSENRETRKYNRKDTIFEEGQYAKYLFFVVEGQVKTSKINDMGKELITHLYGPGEFFGYVSLLSDGKYQTSAFTTEDTILRLIPAEDFKLLLFNSRDFAAKFVKMLAADNDQTESQLLDLAYSSVRRKVANALLTLNDKNGSRFSFLRDDLAGLAGSAKETVIRTLSDFKSEKIIDIDDGEITILKIEELQVMPQ